MEDMLVADGKNHIYKHVKNGRIADTEYIP